MNQRPPTDQRALDNMSQAVAEVETALVAAIAALSATADAHQVVLYDLAQAAAALRAARVALTRPARAEGSMLAFAFGAEALYDVISKSYGRESLWGVDPGIGHQLRPLIAPYRTAEFVAQLAELQPPRSVGDEFELAAETFRRFADDKIRPHAEHVHRTNADVPDDVIKGLAAIGGFGLSVPADYGGFASGTEDDYLAMVIATEELSRVSLGIGGSLITRPEILTRALMRGGTEAQKQQWLPMIASGEKLIAIAVTEPDFGSDVAGVRTSARAERDGYVINGTKTWCTFAARAEVLMLLARTDPASVDHRGLTAFIVDKPRGDGHGFRYKQPQGGLIEGRAIDTIGYRGMHSYEIAFRDWWVPASAAIGEAGGIGRGFYLQMEGFENGRLQTAARAVGLMQAAYEAALSYSRDRIVFGSPIFDYQLTRAKLGRMAMLIFAGREFAYDVARKMGRGEGTLEASMVKAYVCRAAEWVAREAMQIHGGMGYAEEYPVSRYYVDARVLSIFEGADETLCLKVIARGLAREAGRALTH